MSEKNTIPVFVYGTLRKGSTANHFLADATYVGEDTTKQKSFDMVDLYSSSTSSFPGVVKTGKFGIEGDVYLVNDDTLSMLDDYESNGSLYNRELIELSGFKDKAWIYFFNLARFERNFKVLDWYESERISHENNTLVWEAKSLKNVKPFRPSVRNI